jgi:type II secretory pathway pseudopilin PulG
VAAKGKDREQRAAQERARRYAARQELYRHQLGRRRRDNVIAGVVGGLLILAVIAGQVAFFTVGPGVPEPTPTSTPTPTVSSSPDVSPTPEATPTTAGTDAPAE